MGCHLLTSLINDPVKTGLDRQLILNLRFLTQRVLLWHPADSSPVYKSRESLDS